MASLRVEEVFLANQVFGNNNTLGSGITGTTNLQTQTAINGFSTLLNLPIHNVVGLMNDDTETCILTNALLTPARRVRFFQTHNGRVIRYSDLINRNKIKRIDFGTWRHYHPVVYRLDFTNISNALVGDQLTFMIKLSQEEDFDYHKMMVQHTFSGTGSGNDVVEIVNKFNFVSTKLTKNFIPFKAFTGTATGTIDFAGPNPANLFIYIIAGYRRTDRQNIRQLDIYDFYILDSVAYRASTNTTTYDDFNTVIPAFSIRRGTIGLSTYTYNSGLPISYDVNGNPISQITGSTFNQDTSTTQPKPSNSNGFYEDIITNYYQSDFGRVQGHLNRIFLPDEVEIPNILKTVLTVGAGIDLTNRYNFVNIEYEEEVTVSTQQNQNSRKNKTFTLYYNASLNESGNILNNASYSTNNWIQATDGLRNLITNLML